VGLAPGGRGKAAPGGDYAAPLQQLVVTLQAQVRALVGA